MLKSQFDINEALDDDEYVTERTNELKEKYAKYKDDNTSVKVIKKPRKTRSDLGITKPRVTKPVENSSTRRLRNAGLID